MARESTITILRSTGTDIPTGLTFGELAYSDLNGKLFVGKNDGSSLWVGAGITAGSIATNSDYLVPTQSAVKAYVDGVVGGGSVVNTFNGSGGAITLTGDSGAISNSQSTTSNKITARLATASLTGVASFNSTYLTVSNGAVSLASAYQVTGDTVAAGTGIAVSKSGNTSTVTNSGVLSFNSATGAVNYSPAIASSSVTGVASFNSTYFAVGATGHVTLASSYQVTGQTVVSGGGSQTVNTSGNTVTIDNRVASASVTGVASFNSTYLTVSNGAVSLASAYQVTGDTVAAGTGISVSKSGNTSTVTNSGVLSFNSATGAVNYSPAIASASVTGVASFNSTYFAVGATGHVTLASSYQATGQTVVSGGSSQLVSTSGNTVTIDNRIASTSVTGVASFNSTYFAVGGTGAVTLASAYQVTGDTVAAGTGISVSRSGNTSTVTNSGVQSFNSATGAVNYSPVIATTSVTGVASFNSTHFTVSGAGAVSSTGITVKVSSGDAGSTLNSGGTLTITGTANEINIQRTASTYTIGLPTDVTIGGNLTVNGTVVTANVDSFIVEDPLIMLGTGNAADSVDLGFYSQYTTAGRLFSGFFRDASDSGKYKLFTGLTGTAEPTTTVNVAGSGYTVATLVAKIDGGSF